MTEETKNIKLIKPDETEFYDVNVTNRNWDIVDEQVGALKNPEYETPEEPAELVSGENLGTALGKLAAAVRLLLTHKVQQATATILGHVKLSDSAAITEKGVYALDAVEKNASVEGTLANKIEKKQNLLGFTPVQQGGGINQGTNKIYLGWNGALFCTVDSTNIGAFSFQGHTHNYAGSGKSGGAANAAYKVYAMSHPDTWYMNPVHNGTYFYTNFKYGDQVIGMSVDYAISAYRCTGGINKGGNGVGISDEANYFRTYNNAGSPVDNVMGLGSSNARWKQLYAATTSISTSDRNMKDNIRKLTDIHRNFFMKLVPVSFTFKDGESGRTHVGFIAQDVEQAMNECGLTALDFAGFCKDVKVETYLDEESGNYKEKTAYDNNGNEQYIYSLRYEEFIALIAYVLQDTIGQVSVLRETMETISKDVDALKLLVQSKYN